MRFINKCKKGSIFDVILLLIVPVIFLFILIAFFFIYTETSAGLEDVASQLNSATFNQSIQPMQHNAAAYPSFWDTLGIFLIFGMWLIIFAISFILGNNPIFLVFYVMASFALVVTALVFQTVFNNILSNISLQVFFVNFPKMTFLISNFFPFALLFIVSIAIALYLKPK